MLATGAADSAEIEEVLGAIKVRNLVAHEGYLPSDAEAITLRSVMRTIQRLAGLEEIKSPVLTLNNMLEGPQNTGE